MNEDTPNLHTPPEEHALVAPGHSHHVNDMEQALEDHEHHHNHHGEPPMVILDRRFASGEITKEIYLESKELLLKK